jgi:transposase
MRKSFNGLIALVRHTLAEDPFSATLFLFVNRRGNYVKGLYWDRTGYCLYAKRLERGQFTIPGRSATEMLDESTLRLILDGIALGGRRRLG